MAGRQASDPASRQKLIAQIKAEFQSVERNERERRLWAAAKAISLGDRGKVLVHKATEISRPTIDKGIRELAEQARTGNRDDNESAAGTGRIRKPGGGRKGVATLIIPHLDALIDPPGSVGKKTASPLRWTCKTTKQLLDGILSRIANTVARNDRIQTFSERALVGLLEREHFELMNRGRSPPDLQDREEQCRVVVESVREFVRKRLPAVFVDLQRRPAARAGKDGLLDAKTRRRMDQQALLDSITDTAWTHLTMDQQVAGFAARGVARWWKDIGRDRFTKARAMLVVAVGINDRRRRRAWEAALQQTADDTRLAITRADLPPVTFRWRSIGDRLHYVGGDGFLQAVIGSIGGQAHDEDDRIVVDPGDEVGKIDEAELPASGALSSALGWNGEILPGDKT